ncbi:MAG: CGNR zinc finger domain-containing protein [Acidobacteriota bacterium]
MTNSEFLQFVVDFLNADLTRLRAGDFMNLREDIAAALAPGTLAAFTVPLDPPLPADLTEEDLAELQREILAFAGIRKEDPETGELIPEPPRTMTELPIRGCISQFDREGFLFTISGTVRNVLLTRLGIAVGTLQPDIGRCPECGKLLIREGRRKFCSRRCANLASVKRYNRRQKEDSTNGDSES